jgi:hypothetical protein
VIALLLSAALAPFATLTDYQKREIIEAVCGPNGASAWSDTTGPKCNRPGWNGKGYGKVGVDWNDEFFCDEFALLDPKRCGL